MYKKLFIFSLIFVFIDQIAKILVSFNMNLNQSISIINNFFNLTYVQNIGAAFSMLSGARFLFILIAIITLVIIYFNFIKNKKLNNFEIIIYSLLIGGIIGNLIDRILFGYVIDFLDFNIFGYDFAIFNLADTFIVVSIILLTIKTIKEDLCKNI